MFLVLAFAHALDSAGFWYFQFHFGVGVGGEPGGGGGGDPIWMVVKIMVPFWVPIIIRPLVFRVPKKRP